jgi:hypothetical protein
VQTPICHFRSPPCLTKRTSTKYAATSLKGHNLTWATIPDISALVLRQGSSRCSFACLNHFRNMSSVSIISVKPARLIFTVETIEGEPDSAWP